MNNVRRKVLGYNQALVLLKEGKAMVQRSGVTFFTISIGDATVKYPDYLKLLKLCTREKTSRDNIYSLKKGYHVVATCHWCHAVIESPDCHNLVHLGGVGEVYACDEYLKGGNCLTISRIG